MHRDGENRQLLVAAKPYLQPHLYKTTIYLYQDKTFGLPLFSLDGLGIKLTLSTQST
jgi:hypothetical protein